MLNSVSTKVRVYKAGGICCAPALEKPWNVSAPHWPHESFATWREAMDHALKWRYPVMINCAPQRGHNPQQRAVLAGVLRGTTA